MSTRPEGRSKPSREPQGAYAEREVKCTDAALLQELAGEQNSHLKTVEQKLQLTVGQSSEGLLLRGQDADVELGSNVLNQLLKLIEEGFHIFPGDVERSIDMLSSDRKLNLKDIYREQVRIHGRRHPILPKNVTQKIYLEAIKNNPIVFGIGPAGTGKTYLAMAMAVSALMKKDVKRVVLCRPAVEAGEKLGFLPGDMAEKVNPYLRPLYDALHDMVDYERAHEMVEKGIIEVAPLAFMRGRTLSNSFVILDEAQNTSQGQMKMILTRLGNGSRCVITGDITQIDLPRGVTSGLVEALRILQAVQGIATIEFSEQDVIRHPIVGRIVEAYGRAQGNRGQ